MTTFVLTLVALTAILVAALVINTARLAQDAERLVPPCGVFITVDGVRLHYCDEGAGPTLLLIHGLGSQLQSFTYALTARLEGRYRMIMVDRPGCGYSEPAARSTLGVQADLLAGFLRALDVDKALVVGHSLGGAVALALALDHPDRVAGLVLLAPATQPQDVPPEALRRLAIRFDIVRWLVGWTIAAPLSVRTRELTVGTLFAPDPPPTPEDFGRRGGSALTLRPKTFRGASRDLVEAGEQLDVYAARYGTLRVPVGVLFGDGDRILDHALHALKLRDQIADLELELIEGGGHMTPLSSPDRSAAAIDRVAARAGMISLTSVTPRAQVPGAG